MGLVAPLEKCLRVAGIGLMFAALAWPASAQDSLLGSKAPACAGETLDGFTPGDVVPRLAGKVTYIDFWASWCAPCVKAFPVLNAWHAELGDRGFQVVAINLDERPRDAQAFLKRHRADFTLVKDTGGACPRAYRVKGMPSSYLVDRSGVIREVHTGFRDSDAAARRAGIEALLAEPARPGR